MGQRSLLPDGLELLLLALVSHELLERCYNILFVLVTKRKGPLLTLLHSILTDHAVFCRMSNFA